MERKNCWEFLKCAREPNGEKADELGICPASLPNEFDGFNNGKHSGRFCWVVAGTYCNEEVSGTYDNKLLDCINCDFLKYVNNEEGREFQLTPKNKKE